MEPTKELRQAVKEYKAGKAEAFTTLYEESSKYVYTCIYKVMVGNDNAQDIINDIMQDTYVEISKYISQLEDEDKFLSWAGTIATRKCYAYLKKNKKYVLLNEEDNTFDNLSDSDSIIPEEVLQDREKQRLVREIIETQLTEMQRLCIIAYYYNEQKQSEIAEELGIPENTVKTNISRAKAKIKDGVLDLEKKQGTKLYSVAPFLLLLFKEEVQAAVVPKEVTEGIMSAVSDLVSAGTGAATKGIIGKIASASLKTKIIAGLVTVGVIGGVAGTVYVAGQSQQSVENEYETQEASEEASETIVETAEMMTEQVTEQSEEATKQEIEVSEEEKEKFRLLVQFLTATRWGEDLSGQEIVPNKENVCSFISRLADENHEYDGWPYAKYLPERVETESSQSFTEQSIKDYVKEVFGIEIAGVEPYTLYEQNGYYVPMGAQFSSADKCIIDKVVAKGDTYIVTGTDAFGEYPDIDSTEPVYIANYQFTMLLEKNEKSPFGFTLKSISYEAAELSEEDKESSANYLLKDILLYPSLHTEYYPFGDKEYQIWYNTGEVKTEKVNYMEKVSDIWFALADIDRDGSDEILVASCYSQKQFAAIINILKYDKETYTVTDMDGNKIYEPIGTGQHLYDTGILRTCTEAATNNTFFWNLNTGEFWQGDQYLPVDMSLSIAESEAHAELITPDGTVVSGEEGDELYASLSSGTEIPLLWYKATEENIDVFLFGGTGTALSPSEAVESGIQIPYGTYKSTRGHTLDFSPSGEVLVSEGGGNTWCNYTIDVAGNMIIFTENESIEATYYPAENRVSIYGIDYK